MNNITAIRQSKEQFVFLLDGKDVKTHTTYEANAKQLRGNPRLTPVQSLNLELNLQLIEMEQIRIEKGIDVDEDIDTVDDPF